MDRLVQTLVDAVSVGSLYALTALGIGLIFGVMRLINFAHGELITFVAYTLAASSACLSLSCCSARSASPSFWRC